jgi:hypothetical protein
MIPDARILPGLRKACVKQTDVVGNLEAAEAAKQEEIERDFQSAVESITLDNLNRLLGIKQWGYRA